MRKFEKGTPKTTPHIRHSGESTEKGKVRYGLGKTGSGETLKDEQYSIGLRRVKPKNGSAWSYSGKKSKAFPKGSGSYDVSYGDIRKGLHSISKYLSNGGLSQERIKIHDEAIEKLFAGKKPVPEGERKVFQFLGGGPASGKGSFTRPDTAKQFNLLDNKENAVIDPDEMKKELPEYDEEKGMLDRNKAASFVHEESSSLAKRAMDAAFANGYNCTFDGTGDGSVESVMKKVNAARKEHYFVEAAYCTQDIDRAIRNSDERAEKTGRYVQHDTIINTHKAVSKIVPQVMKEFDHFTLWDNNERGKSKLIVECYRGKEPIIHDEEAWQRFLDKKDYGKES